MLSLSFLAVPVSAKLSIVTTTEDLAAIAAAIGGDAVSVQSIARGYQDPHFVEAKPSHLLKLKRAGLFIQIGLELEAAWAGALLQNARNPDLLPGNPGFLEVSQECEILDRPTGPVDRSKGDVHPLGNPHYWTDPENGRMIARSVARKLSELAPADAGLFQKNLRAFEEELDRKSKEWVELAAPLRGLPVVTYHNSWVNFARRFGLEVIDFVEPRPGVPPSPAHVRSLIGKMKARKVPIILIETYWDVKVPMRIAEETGAALAVLPASVGGRPHIHSYFDLFDHNLRELRKALGVSTK
ncbi:MAG: metal ABC transporter substrate-binding protein [Elusimicrobiota bacterium]